MVLLETSKENIPRRKLVKRLPMDSVLVEIYLGPRCHHQLYFAPVFVYIE